MNFLDKELQLDLTRLMRQFLEIEKETPEQAQKAWKIWKTQNLFEFLYGHWIGYFTGLCEGVVQERYKRDVSFEERNEIIELVEQFAPKLRDYLDYLKSR